MDRHDAIRRAAEDAARAAAEAGAAAAADRLRWVEAEAVSPEAPPAPPVDTPAPPAPPPPHAWPQAVEQGVVLAGAIAALPLVLAADQLDAAGAGALAGGVRQVDAALQRLALDLGAFARNAAAALDPASQAPKGP